MMLFGDDIRVGQIIISAGVGAVVAIIPIIITNKRDDRNRYNTAAFQVINKLLSELKNIKDGHVPSSVNTITYLDIISISNFTSKRHASKIKKAWDSYTESVDEFHWKILANGDAQFNNSFGYKISIEKLVKIIKKY